MEKSKGFFLDIFGLKLKIISNNKRFDKYLKRLFIHFICEDIKSDKLGEKYKKYKSKKIIETRIDSKNAENAKKVKFRLGKNLFHELILAYDKIMNICSEYLQNRFLLLHASSCVLDGRTYVFVGRTGLGKSRVVRRLMKRGAKYVGDDPILVSQSGEIIPFPKPIVPRYTYRGMKFVKFYVPKSICKPIKPYNFIVYKNGSGEKFEMEKLGDAESAFEMLKNVQNLDYEKSFDIILKVLKRGKFFRINRPFYSRDITKVLQMLRNL